MSQNVHKNREKDKYIMKFKKFVDISTNFYYVTTHCHKLSSQSVLFLNFVLHLKYMSGIINSNMFILYNKYYSPVLIQGTLYI